MTGMCQFCIYHLRHLREKNKTTTQNALYIQQDITKNHKTIFSKTEKNYLLTHKSKPLKAKFRTYNC